MALLIIEKYISTPQNQLPLFHLAADLMIWYSQPALKWIRFRSWLILCNMCNDGFEKEIY